MWLLFVVLFGEGVSLPPLPLLSPPLLRPLSSLYIHAVGSDEAGPNNRMISSYIICCICPKIGVLEEEDKEEEDDEEEYEEEEDEDEDEEEEEEEEEEAIDAKYSDEEEVSSIRTPCIWTRTRKRWKCDGSRLYSATTSRNARLGSTSTEAPSRATSAALSYVASVFPLRSTGSTKNSFVIGQHKAWEIS